MSAREGRAVLLAAMAFWGCAPGAGGPGDPGASGALDRPPAPASAAGIAVTEGVPNPDLLNVRFAAGHSIPVLRLNSRDVLGLEFDMAASVTGSYSIRFTPASRDWVPSSAREPLPMPRPDYLQDYETFFGLELNYLRYSYEFPNPRVSFPRSGNYLLEVLDHDSAVLFARRFCVSDDELDLTVQPRRGTLTEVPEEIGLEVRVDLPRDPNYAPEDCTVCLIKNGWTAQTLCTTQPRVEGPTYVFTIEDAFRPTVEVRYTDLRSDQFVSRRFEHTVPATSVLFPDDFRALQKYQYSSPIPRGQRTDSKEAVPYVLVRFSIFDTPKSVGAPYLVGTFNDWEIDPAYRMKWDDENSAYSLDLLAPEAEGYYAYLWDDVATVTDRTRYEGPTLVSYTALLYATDSRYPTDRLLAVKGQQIP